MTNEQILNRIDHELATLNRRYTTLDAGQRTPGVDTKAIRVLMDRTADEMIELRRQAEFVK